MLPGLDNAVGGHENLFHANGFKPIVNWNDRLECTTGEMGGLPDVNTENPDFQYYYLQYVNDLINLGARGFRYDTAKHIGLPSDPLDPKARQNDFWDVATGRKAVRGLSLYIYGEVLQDKNVKETEYDDYMDLTASSYGHALRNAIVAENVYKENLLDWHHPSAPTDLVTWVESHDTYCNAHESAGISDDAIRAGWAFITARSTGRPLFFSRPAGSTRENYWGNNRIGARGNDEFFHPEVVAVNSFRHKMAGQPETVSFSKDGKAAEISRGDSGAALISFSSKPQKVKLETNLLDGEYTDSVHKAAFKVKNGFVEGRLDPFASYMLYAR